MMWCIHYPNHGLFVCSSISSCFIKTVFDKFHDKYVFMQFTCPKKYLCNTIEKINKLKNKHIILHEAMWNFYSDFIHNSTEENEFTCIILGDDEEKRVMGINKYADLYICVSSSYYDTFEYGISTARLQDKFLMLYYVR